MLLMLDLFPAWPAASNHELRHCLRIVQVALFILQAVSMGMGIAVGQARKKYGITYPALYAVPGTKCDYAPVSVCPSAPSISAAFIRASRRNQL